MLSRPLINAAAAFPVSCDLKQNNDSSLKKLHSNTNEELFLFYKHSEMMGNHQRPAKYKKPLIFCKNVDSDT